MCASKITDTSPSNLMLAVQAWKGRKEASSTSSASLLAPSQPLSPALVHPAPLNSTLPPFLHSPTMSWDAMIKLDCAPHNAHEIATVFKEEEKGKQS